MNKTPTQNQPGILKLFRGILSRLSPKRKIQYGVLLVMMIGLAFLEMGALGMLAVYAYSIADPVRVMDSRYVQMANEFIFGYEQLTASKIIIMLSILVMIVFIIKNIVKGLFVYTQFRFSTAVEADLGQKLFDGMLEMPYEWFLNHNSANLIMIMNWRVNLGRSFIAPFNKMISDSLVVLFLLTLLVISTDPSTLGVIAGLSLLAYGIFKYLKINLDKAALVTRDVSLSINKMITMSIQGVKDIMISNIHGFFARRFYKKAIDLSANVAKKQFYSESPAVVLETIVVMMLSSVILIMLVVKGMGQGAITGTMALLAVAVWRAMPAMNRVVTSLAKIRGTLPNTRLVFEYLVLVENNQQTMEEERPEEIQPISFSERIEIKGVSFSYKTRDVTVLKEINLTIQKGETVGIVGVSGSGKSTLVDVLIGLLVPDRGEVLIDDNVLTRNNRSYWFDHIGYVPQTPYIYDGTIAENIAYGIPEEKIDFNHVLETCERANLNFIDELPDGIYTPIGERGMQLSGGQKQRLSIARALYHEPEVLIFDEATSALDTQSENAIMNTIYGLKGSITMVLIAHRLSSLERCDKIAWIHDRSIKMVDKPERIIPEYEKVITSS